MRHFNSSERVALYLAAEGRCRLCGDRLEPGWHADHVVPWSLGGPTDVVNGQALCPGCNLMKGDSILSSETLIGLDGFPFVSENQAFSPPADLEVRDWQTEALQAFIEKLKEFPPVAFGTRMEFLLAAGPGAGKTIAAALIASYLLNEGLIRRVAYIAPNRGIAKDVKRAFKRFGIHLVDWRNDKYGAGEPISFQGAVLTYQSLASKPELQRILCRTRTLVIFDEIHHLGENQWDQKACEGFKDAAAFILGLSGTPYRSDNKPIPFVRYVDDPERDGIRKFKADYSYSLGRAIADGVCRKPQFHWLDAEVQIPRACGGFSTVTFADELSDDSANMRLAACVKPGSRPRKEALQLAIDICRVENRRLIIFVGGDTSSVEAAGQADASKHIPAELIELGVDPSQITSVTSNDTGSLQKIDGFAKSPAWVMVSVNLVSEGVDIPVLSVALFLTTITAKSTTVQRIGRILRTFVGDPHDVCKIIMFDDPRYREFATEIENDWSHELDLRRRRDAAERNGDGEWEPPAKREAVGVRAWPNGFTANSIHFSEADRKLAIRLLRGMGHPVSDSSIGLMVKLVKEGRIAPEEAMT